MASVWFPPCLLEAFFFVIICLVRAQLNQSRPPLNCQSSTSARLPMGSIAFFFSPNNLSLSLTSSVFP